MIEKEDIRQMSTARPRLKKCSLQVLALAAVVVLGCAGVLAQSSTTVPVSVTPEKTDASGLASGAPPASSQPPSPVTVLENTLIRVQTIEPVNSKRTKHGTPVLFIVNEDVVVGDVPAIPRGATVHGVVMKSKKSGRLTGSAELTLELVSLELGGRSYPLYTYQFKATGVSKTKPTETKAIRGAAVGAIAGSVAFGVSAKGLETTAVAAGLGAGVGTAISALSPGPGIQIPSEAEVDFYLAAPITITPVSAKEAARLAEGLHSGGPVLYLRGDTP
jgi:hypothetical protein